MNVYKDQCAFLEMPELSNATLTGKGKITIAYRESFPCVYTPGCMCSWCSRYLLASTKQPINLPTNQKNNPTGHNILALWVKPPLASLSPHHQSAGLCLGCSFSDPAPAYALGKTVENGPQCLGPH